MTDPTTTSAPSDTPAPADPTGTASWAAFADEAPQLAAAVRARFEAATHHVLATLRRDGWPRASGTEVSFHDGQLCVGSMWRARKALDLLRDPRLSLHSNPGDPTMADGDAKVTGMARELTGDGAKTRFLADVFDGREAPPPDDPWHLFVVELTGAVLTTVDAEAGVMTITHWRPGSGLAVHRR